MLTPNQVGSQLISRSYCQIGMIEAGAGMAVYFFIYAQSGFALDRLVNIRETWDVKAVNDLEDDYGQGIRLTRRIVLYCIVYLLSSDEHMDRVIFYNYENKKIHIIFGTV